MATCVLAAVSVWFASALPVVTAEQPSALALWLGLAFAHLVVLCFGLICYVCGLALARLLFPADVDLTATAFLPHSVGLGVYVFVGATLPLAALNLLSIATILTVSGAMAGLGLLTLRLRPQSSAHKAIPFQLDSVKSRVLCGVAAVVAGLWFAPYWLMMMLPAYDWDTLMYHLPLAQRFLDVGAWDMDPMQGAFAFPAAPHLAYAAFLALGADQGVVLINFGASLLTVWATFVVARHHWSPRVAWLAVFALASHHMIWELGLDARIDGFQSLFTILAVDALLRWLKNSEHPGWLMIFAMMAGLAIGTKYTAVAFFGLTAPVVFVGLVIQWRQKRPQLMRVIPLALVLVAIPSAFWFARNLAVTGSAVYPYRSALLYETDSGELRQVQPVIGDFIDASPPSKLWAQEEQRLDEAGLHESPRIEHLFNWWAIFTQPDLFQSRHGQHLSPVVLLFFLLPLFAPRSREAWLIFYLGFGFYLFIAPQIWVLRYLLPVLPLFALGTALVLGRPSSKAWAALMCCAMAIFIISDWASAVQRLRVLAPQPYLTGELADTRWQCQTQYHPHGCWVHFINSGIEAGEIPKDAHILMVAESRGAQLQCSFDPDMSMTGTAWLLEVANADGDYREVAAQLRERGVTHIVYNPSRIRWARGNMGRGGVRRLVIAIDHLLQFIDEQGEVIYRSERDFTAVIAIHDPAPQEDVPQEGDTPVEERP